jgi:glycosyltransferase involved in cell wall biosynthesis
MTSDVSGSALVTVLMSTYNGSQYLQQQLESIYEQTYTNVKILVRDDGSTDSTPSRLADEQQRGKIEQLDTRNNLGATGSFFALLHHAAQSNTEYVAFCDQDDVWLAEKTKRAVSLLASVADRPALYCCRLDIVDEHLRSLKLSPKPQKIGFGNALVENIAVGCTIVLNRKALKLLCLQTLPDVYAHDWWCYLVISCFGEVIFDNSALIKYRQHGGNAIGAATNPYVALKRNINRLLNGRPWISQQAAVFLALFAEHLSPAQRKLTENICKSKTSWRYRVRLASSPAIWRNNWLENIILRLVILMNRF